MQWECPFNRRGGVCRRFDGPCEPHSPGCLLAHAPHLESDAGESTDRVRLLIEPMPWPTLARPRRLPGQRGRRRRAAPPSQRSTS